MQEFQGYYERVQISKLLSTAVYNDEEIRISYLDAEGELKEFNTSHDGLKGEYDSFSITKDGHIKILLGSNTEKDYVIFDVAIWDIQSIERYKKIDLSMWRKVCD